MKFHVMTGTNHGVLIRIVEGDNTLDFWSVGELTKFASAAIREQIDRAMDAKIAAIKREAYAAGWKDAKARKKRRTTFYGCLNADPTVVGY